ncbi:MAG: hypothetical protein ACFFDN_28205 [Candidatus Hodarchaeota archaeon]
MKVVERDYNMPDSELMFLAGDLVTFMTRDSAEFALRGVDAAAITAFETLGNEFEVFPPDEYYSAQVTAEVEAKNTARDNSYDWIQKISGFFEQQWGLNSWQYNQLGIKRLFHASDDKFKSTCRNVVAVANDQLSNLTAIGLTQADIDALDAEAQTMEDKGHATKEKVALRDSKTQERTEKGNELFSYCKKYATIGKLIWENVDEAKYNDYIIYKKEPQGLGKVKNLAYDVPTKTASWDALQYADDYQLQYKPPQTGAEWEIAYEGADTSTVFDPGLDAFTLRCRGHNADGYGSWSYEVNVIIPTG